MKNVHQVNLPNQPSLRRSRELRCFLVLNLLDMAMGKTGPIIVLGGLLLVCDISHDRSVWLMNRED